jgi:hypothetical protein
MPTPQETGAQAQLVIDSPLDRSAHSTCPVENERPGGSRRSATSFPVHSNSIDDEASQQQDSPHSDDDAGVDQHCIRTKTTLMNRESTPSEGLSPMSIVSEPREADLQETSTSRASSLGASFSISYGIDDTRVCCSDF